MHVYRSLSSLFLFSFLETRGRIGVQEEYAWQKKPFEVEGISFFSREIGFLWETCDPETKTDSRRVFRNRENRLWFPIVYGMIADEVTSDSTQNKLKTEAIFEDMNSSLESKQRKRVRPVTPRLEPEFHRRFFELSWFRQSVVREEGFFIVFHRNIYECSYVI